MNLSSFFIHRPVMTLLLTASVIFSGVLAYQKLPVSALPNVNYPAITVSVSYPGSSPLVMANTVVSPLERQFLTIGGLKTLASTSSLGSANVVLQFDLNKNIDGAALDVQSAINAALGDLPQDLPHAPTYSKVSTAQTPVLYFALTSVTMPRYELYDYAYTLVGERLSTVSGVAKVEVYGSPFAIRVQVDPQKLAARGIGIDEVAIALEKANTHLPIGVLNGPYKEVMISTDGQLEKTFNYDNVVIKNSNNQIVRIQDVGRAVNSTSSDQEYQQLLTEEGAQDSVIFGILTQPGVNTMEVIEAIDEVLPHLKSTLPGSITLKKFFDKSDFIQESLFDVEITVILSFILVIGVIFFYFGKLRNTLIPALSLPLAVMGGFTVMLMGGLSLDILSLLAITLSLGFLVDDAIVVLENIMRHAEMGKPPLQAALEGSKEIVMTVVSMTLALCAVFIPLFAMKGVIGELFYEFSFVIVILIGLSGVISLTLTPLLCSRFIAVKTREPHKSQMQEFSSSFQEALQTIYQRTLQKSLACPKAVLSICVICISATVGFFVLLPSDFLPPDDLGLIIMRAQALPGTSPHEMKTIQKELEQKIRFHPAVQEIISIAPFPDSNKGGLFVSLKPFQERESIFKVMDDFNKVYETSTKAKIYMKPLPLIDLQVSTSSTNAAYQYTLQSLNTEDLYLVADTFMNKMKMIPEIKQVSSDMELKQPGLFLSLQRDQADLLSVSAEGIESVLSYAFGKRPITFMNQSQNQYDVILEVEKKFSRDKTNLNQLYVRSSKGPLVPLSSLVKAHETVGPLNINRINGMPAVNLFFDIGKAPLGPVLEQIKTVALETLPSTVIGTAQGNAEVFQSSLSSLYIALVIAFFVVYVILGILYEDFLHPLTVMSTLPPAAFGGLATLALFREPLSLYAFVGLILLLGIVMKNGIMMVDFATTYFKQGKTHHDSITQACLERFRPILMTTFSALMGAVPIAIGIGGMTAQSRRSLGLVIIGGLLISQVITLYVTPALYLFLERIRSYFLKSE
ncbi:efflux RND transporter permease subunit [Rhabdochlamydiaceae symbiont of Dictyostelium giganteum]|uniref:efflux RND transporter permease subunit n=1 Tax=Rhabdochlamydiaceae symbiont of Dictyostelium giganteum TaxID=3342349 RepID=UPI0038507CE1